MGLLRPPVPSVLLLGDTWRLFFETETLDGKDKKIEMQKEIVTENDMTRRMKEKKAMDHILALFLKYWCHFHDLLWEEKSVADD